MLSFHCSRVAQLGARWSTRQAVIAQAGVYC